MPFRVIFENLDKLSKADREALKKASEAGDADGMKKVFKKLAEKHKDETIKEAAKKCLPRLK